MRLRLRVAFDEANTHVAVLSTVCPVGVQPDTHAVCALGRVWEFQIAPASGDSELRVSRARVVEEVAQNDEVQVLFVPKSAFALTRVVVTVSRGDDVPVNAATQWRGRLLCCGSIVADDDAVVTECAPFAEGFVVNETVFVWCSSRGEGGRRVVSASSLHHHISSSAGLTPLYEQQFQSVGKRVTALTVNAHIWFDQIESEADRDFACSVGVHSSLLKTLGVFSGAWADLGGRLVRLCLLDNSAINGTLNADRVVLVPPTLMANLFGLSSSRPCPQRVEGVRLNLCQPELPEQAKGILDVASVSAAVGARDAVCTIVAAKRIAVVRLEEGSASQQLNSVRDGLLNLYFATVKVVRVGDLITCFSPSRPFPSTTAAAPYVSDSPERVVWKVVSMQAADGVVLNEAATALVHRDFCSVFEEDSGRSGSRSFVPPTRSAFDGKHFDGQAELFSVLEARFDAAAEKSSGGTVFPPSSVLLHSGGPGFGKRRMVHECGEMLGIPVIHYSGWDVVSDIPSNTLSSLSALFDLAQDSAPCILLLSHLEAICQSNPNVASSQRVTGHVEALFAKRVAEIKGERLSSAAIPALQRVMFIATTDSLDRVTGRVRSCFFKEIEVGCMAEQAREEFLSRALSVGRASRDAFGAPQKWSSATRSMPVRLMTASLAEGWKKLYADVSVVVEQNAVVDRSQWSELVLRGQDLQAGVAAVQSYTMHSMVGAPDIPNVRWEDIGGMQTVRQEILDTISLPLEHPELFAGGAKQRSGVLLYGPPGTGKTLVAKAVATECALAFISVKGPELINSYVGESERNVRQLFARARAASPCVVFMDELDSLAPRRGMGADSGGVMDRIVSQLLAELDGLGASSASAKDGETKHVFVIGATNRPDLLDASLLRPGRLDRLLYCGMMPDPEAQASVLRALTRKFQLSPNVDLLQVAKKLPRNFTGADAYALSSGSWLMAAKRVISETSASSVHAGGDGNNGVVVTMEDFESALKNISPSVSEDELRYYESIRKDFTK